jgi:hypothetical protein
MEQPGFLCRDHWFRSGGKPMPEVGEQPGDVTTGTGPAAPGGLDFGPLMSVSTTLENEGRRQASVLRLPEG